MALNESSDGTVPTSPQLDSSSQTPAASVTNESTISQSPEQTAQVNTSHDKKIVSSRISSLELFAILPAVLCRRTIPEAALPTSFRNATRRPEEQRGKN